MAKSWRMLCFLAAFGLCFGLVACSDDDDTLPTEAAHISIKDFNSYWSGPPLPQVCELVVSLERVSSSGTHPVEDGIVITFTTDRWQFDNGQQRVVVETSGGQARARVVADAPGSATIRMSGEIGGAGFGLTTNLYLSDGG